MDTITPSTQENVTPTTVAEVATPSVNQEVSGPLSSQIPRWAQVLVACSVVILVLSLAVWYGSKRYYQVKPLNVSLGENQGENTVPTVTSSVDSSSTEFVSVPYDLSSIMVSEYYCSFDQVTVSLGQENKFSTTTLSQLKDELCSALKVQGKTIIKYPTKIEFSKGENAIVGIIMLSGKTYLSLFTDNFYEKYTLELNSAKILPVATVSEISRETIKTLMGASPIVKVSEIDASRNQTEQYFKRVVTRYAGGSLVEIVKNPDGTFSDKVLSASEYDVAQVSFLAPYSIYLDRTITNIESFVDASKNTITAYHKEGCGLEDAYSDMSFHSSDYSTTIGINFGFSPSLNITTTRTGYDPQQWGKVIEKVSMTDFRASVQKPKALNSNSPVEMLTIGEYQVKHIGPIIPDKSCYASSDNHSFDIYQAVKNGAVVTFTVFNQSGVRNNLDEKQKFISQVLTTLTFSKR